MHAAVDAGGDENVRQLRALPIRCSGSCAKRCARELRKLVRRQARVVRTAVVRLSHECTRLSFERRALCYALIYQHWWAQPLPLIVPYALVVGELCHKSV